MYSISDKTNSYLKMLGKRFNKEDFCEFIKDLLNLETPDIINGKELNAGTEQYRNYIDKSQLFAKYTDDKRNEIGILIIKLKDNKTPANARTLQRNFIAHLLEYYGLDASLTAIYSETDPTWRLSFVKKEISIEVGKLKTKVSPAKRYSYLFGEDEPNHTAKEQLLELLENNNKKYSVKEIEEKFSVEKVTKDFFEKYKENYLKLKETLEKNDEFVYESKRCDFTSEEFTKKLMGQIVFIYFLQKKGWLGVKLVPHRLSNDEFDEIYKDKDIITKKVLDKYFIEFNNQKIIKKELLEKIKENEEELKVLSNAFVNTKYDEEWGTGEKKFIRKIFNNCLNRSKNFFDDYLEPFFYEGLNHKRTNQYFSVFNCKIPFLNGGLFEPLDNYMWETATFNISNDIFSNENEDGILDFFDRYNFTINEEEPLEKDVAVDPEMLGKIFENLLDVKDRKSKGAFYTPREIVHYMCKESLANYLVNKVNVKYDEIKEFIEYGEMIRDIDLKQATKSDYLVGETVFKNIIKIDEALKNIKVADPAVGSGAFPLGILNEIVKLRDILTSYMLIYNREHLFNKVYTEEEITNNNRAIYKIKWDTIKNCIYAVDIENSAVDITKLRLWLSIVVDQVEVPKSGPEPLPNLDCKIMQGNSLVDEYNGIKLIDEKFVNEFRENDNVRFNDGAKDKKGRYLIPENQIQFGDGQKKVQIDDLIKFKQELYGTNDLNRKKELVSKIQNARKELLKLNFMGTNAEEKLFAIDDTHNKPYFAWMLEFIEVFIENDGFDIVIGNPPYVKEYTDSNIFKELKTNKYYQGKMDFWYFFGCYGLDLLNKSGIEAFIAPNNWITNFGASKLRNKILNEAKIQRFIDFGNYKVFNTADIQTMVYILSKHNYNKELEYKVKYYKLTKSDINDEQLRNFLYNKIQNNNFDIKFEYIMNPINNIDNYIEFLDNKQKQIIDKILNTKNIIYLNDKEIAQGIVCPQDSLNKKAVEKLGKYNVGDGVFVISETELKLMNLTEKELKYIKPYYTSDNILKWKTLKENDFYIIYTTKSINDLIDEYPNLKAHLDKYTAIITSDNKPYGLHRARDEKFFVGEKIISKRKCQEPCFSFSDFDTYVSQTFNIIKTDRVNLKYLIGILNSNLIKYWLKNKGKMQGNNYQIDKEPLCAIPIALNKEYEDILINIVNDIFNNNTNESKLNEIVYKIYNISNEEIKYIEEAINE